MKRKLLLAVLTTILMVQAMAGPAMALEVNDVAGEFICNCGCNKLVSSCEMPCGDNLRAFIKEQIRKGLGREQIIQYMKVNFKDAILAAPEKKGFNWVAWLAPFAVVFAGAILVTQITNSWAGRRGGGDDNNNNGSDEAKKVNKKYNDRIEKELKEFGW